MNVENIINLGEDQMAAMFVMSIPGGIPTGGDDEAVTLRMQESFPMPDDGGGEYEIVYQGLKITKPNMTDATDKHFEVVVRLDQQWKVYDELKTWKDAVYNPVLGTKLPHENTQTTVVVQALDGAKSVVKTFTFNYCWLQKIKVMDFSHTEETPTTLTLTFIYGYME